ncbi:hypothetical protein K504DRAFT_497106 [Pleomassaria siparia CBS 279.74]|uniref:Uncharacterized protein n=1 Tax=Pleomassaria siparia CBS 279.74 TaxID=1314801 RepID=A0A6G1KS65_9PLEO|nr:hypothetical protein K504DRAFT_497106 [Pleomassaria siparia CBS 279.74]
MFRGSWPSSSTSSSTSSATFSLAPRDPSIPTPALLAALEAQELDVELALERARTPREREVAALWQEQVWDNLWQFVHQFEQVDPGFLLPVGDGDKDKDKDDNNDNDNDNVDEDNGVGDKE